MTEQEPSENGKILALAAHGGLFVGIPLFWLLPLVTRDDEFALFHAKQAGALTVLFFASTIVLTVLTVVTCGMAGILLPLLVLFYVPAVYGIYDIAMGQKTEMPLVSDLANLLFGSITLKES